MNAKEELIQDALGQLKALDAPGFESVIIDAVRSGLQKMDCNELAALIYMIRFRRKSP